MGQFKRISEVVFPYIFSRSMSETDPNVRVAQLRGTFPDLRYDHNLRLFEIPLVHHQVLLLTLKAIWTSPQLTTSYRAWLI